MGYVIDLLAAIPSIVYGFWGIATLAPALVPFYGWAEEHLGFIPFFAGPASATGRTMLTAGLMLAVMILPIISAISREVFSQAPALHREAALALGATRWEMIRMAVLPYGKSGVIGGAMLGLGRALGETLAIAIVLSASGGITFNLISSSNPSTIAANIALQFPESTGLDVNTLIASGLALFVITLAVNMHRPLDRQPAGRLLRSQLMTADPAGGHPDHAGTRGGARSSGTAGCPRFGFRRTLPGRPRRRCRPLRAHRLQRRPRRSSTASSWAPWRCTSARACSRAGARRSTDS